MDFVLNNHVLINFLIDQQYAYLLTFFIAIQMGNQFLPM